MCSIVGSFKKEKLVELCKLNEYRGQYSHSISYFDIVTGKLHVERRLGPVNYDIIDYNHLTYCIVHMQAPTGDQVKSIHPAQHGDKYLWHNGILKQEYIKKLRESLGEVCNWDTFLMLRAMSENQDIINEFDGSFSCLMYDTEQLYLFRNEIAPMFIDNEMNISSTVFEGSRSVEPNKVHHVDFNFDDLFAVRSFKTVNNPYYIPEW